MNSNDEKNNADSSGQDSRGLGIEQITKIPSPAQEETLVIKQKIKDPKKVAAGRKLAEYNKKAKEKQKLVLASAATLASIESAKKNDTNASGDDYASDSNNFLPETSFTTIIAFLGLGLTAIDLFMRYKSSKLSQQSDYDDIDRSSHSTSGTSGASGVDSTLAKNNIGGEPIMPRPPAKTIGME